VASSAAGSEEAWAVLRTATIISGKWTLLILRDLSRGVNRYSTLERSLGGISPKTLSDRLKSLEKAGIVTRTAYAEVPPRVEYTLTPMGQELIPLIDHMREYGSKWLMTADRAPGTTPGDGERGA
jgi:DNA-binding HxlR family transcriptional regulator